MKFGQSRALAVIGIAALASLGLTACQNLDDSGGSTPGATADANTIKVGFVTPLTGNIAVFAEGDTFVVEQMREWFKENPIKAGGQEYQVEIILKDSQSSPDRAAQVAQDLITQDGVDVLMAHATPETTVPVSNQCEANAIPCITADTPWQPQVFSRVADPSDPSPLKWSNHFFWGLEDIAEVYQDMWNQVETNKQVAGLFPNDSDGQAWAGALPGMFEAAGYGYELDIPNLYEPGTQDFSALINRFKANGTEIITGVIPPPDFAIFWQQAQQLGYQPKVATIAKAIEFPAAVEALENPVGLTTEVWWLPTAPYTSSLTGLTAAEFADSYFEASGSQWTVALPFAEALFEVFAQAVIDTGGFDKQGIVDAVSVMKIDTLVGTLDWPNGPYPGIAKSPLLGGQWVKDETGKFKYDLVIRSNTLAPNVPTVGTVAPMAY